jgi:hypothetical protein
VSAFVPPDLFVYVVVYMNYRGVAVGVIMDIYAAPRRPTESQPIKVSLHGEDLVEAFHDGSESKYSERKALLELTEVMEPRTPR